MAEVIDRSNRFDWLSIAVYAAALFVSAALLFLIQPMFAKALLPLLGGAPAVWNTCVVFYELILLAGYLYAYFLQRWAKPTLQIILHLTLVIVVLAFLPLRVHALLPPPSSTTAVPWLLFTLAVSLGIPLLVLSATSPLLQNWFATTSHRRAHDPYFLYAASNAGSLLGLLAYPFLLEPLIGLHSQSSIWSIGYFILIACIGLAALIVYRSLRETQADSAGSSTPGIQVNDHAGNASAEPISVQRKVRWVLLAFIPASLMLSVTAYVSSAIAPIPLLWVVPLALYLLTLVIAFSGDSAVRLRRLYLVTPLAALFLVVIMGIAVIWPAPVLILIHLTVFFLIALTCHTCLAADRPSKVHLTEFYLWIATGGALGGIFNAIIAPVIFKTVVEYPLVLILAAFYLRNPAQPPVSRPRLWDIELPLLLGAILAAFLSIEARFAPANLGLKIVLAFSIAALIALFAFRRPLGFALSVAAITLCGALIVATLQNRLYVDRNFFGIKTVYAVGPYHFLLHGATVHGLQNVLPGHRDQPLSYYSRSGPLGQLFSSLRPRLSQAKIADIGEGAGSALCYQTSGQQWTIYEIDPQVDQIARNPRLFTYISDCAAQTPTVVGDARLSLGNVADGAYDLMILDAYSADYVPVHLLTRESLSLYLHKLTGDGLLAFHVSSKWFELEPVLSSLAVDAGLVCYENHERSLTAAQARSGVFESDWLVMARQKSDIGPLASDTRWQPCRPTTFPVWTDDYSSLVTALAVHITIGTQ